MDINNTASVINSDVQIETTLNYQKLGKRVLTNAAIFSTAVATIIITHGLIASSQGFTSLDWSNLQGRFTGYSPEGYVIMKNQILPLSEHIFNASQFYCENLFSGFRSVLVLTGIVAPAVYQEYKAK